ncbi:MAG: hypothetical protein EPN86_02415 [Nanoarchaeota archaeon]|nr:MAG: hypothetical protein EPN86_02415 [Nanoarchaeota archaeon]
MVTASQVVGKILSEKPALQEYLKRSLINYTSLAEYLLPSVERQLGAKASVAAIMMACRRHADSLKIQKKELEKIERGSELLIKTNLIDITVRKSPGLFAKVQKLYSLARYEEGDTLNVIYGNYEASIITNEHYSEEFLSALKGEKILKIDRNLVSLSLRFGETFRSTPGMIASVTSKLTFEHINILEIVSTNTELAVIVRNKDAMRAYASLEEFTSN